LLVSHVWAVCHFVCLGEGERGLWGVYCLLLYIYVGGVRSGQQRVSLKVCSVSHEKLCDWLTITIKIIFFQKQSEVFDRYRHDTRSQASHRSFARPCTGTLWLLHCELALSIRKS
jgi:hypothetical protein